MTTQCLRTAGYRLRLEGYRLESLFEAFDTFAPFEEMDDGLPADLSAEIVLDHDGAANLISEASRRKTVDSAAFLQHGDRLIMTTQNDLFCCAEYNRDYTKSRHYFNGRRFGKLAAHKDQVDFHLYLELRRQLAAYLFLRGELMLHSVSVLFDGEAFALSAPSGTGKTTHAQLWVEHFGAKIIDGDCNACRVHQDGAYIYGLPWCGSSGVTHNERAPLRALVFLERGEQNEARRLSPAESVMRLAARSYLPAWDAALMEGDYLKPAERLAAAVPCYALRCRPDKEAAEVVKNEIFGR